MSKEILSKLSPCQRQFLESEYIRPCPKGMWAAYGDPDIEYVPDGAVLIDYRCKKIGVRVWEYQQNIVEEKLDEIRKKAIDALIEKCLIEYSGQCQCLSADSCPHDSSNI